MLLDRWLSIGWTQHWQPAWKLTGISFCGGWESVSDDSWQEKLQRFLIDLGFEQ
jgi:hypothetical protein